jgi:hypothetical protein
MQRLLLFLVVPCLFLFGLPSAALAEWIPLRLGSDSGASVSIQMEESSAGTTSVRIRIPGYYRDLVAAGSSRFENISLPGYSSLRRAGQPALPVIGIPILLENHAELTIVKVESEFSPAVVPAPFVGRPKRCNGNQNWRMTCDTAVYQQEQPFPETWVTLTQEGRLRGRNLVVLKVHPFRYHPRIRSLETAVEMVIELSSPLLRKVASRYAAAPFDRLARGHFYSLLEPERDSMDREVLLIIVHDSLLIGLDDYIEWKEAAGFQVVVVPLSAIGATSQAVQTYIQEAYDNWDIPPVYVTLVGDGNGDGKVPFVESPYGCASDFLFSAVDGNDLYSDLLIGRFSAHDPAELEVQIRKAIWSEKLLISGSESNWLPRSICISSSEGTGGSNDDVRSDIICGLQADHGYEVADKLYHSNGADTAFLISEKLNEGRGWVTYLGHGSGHSWATTSPPYSNAHVLQLQNNYRLPFIVDVSCSNGEFDSTAGDCFAEAWMKTGSLESPRAGLAIYSASTPTPWDEPAEMAVGMTHALLEGQATRWSELAAAGRSYMMEVLPDGGGLEEVCHQYVVFGDPTLQVRTAVPVILDVAHPAALPLGGTVFPVTVGSLGSAVQDATVSMVLPDGGVVVGKTGADGTVTLWVETSSTGVASLTVTAFNTESYLGTVDTLIPGCGLLQLGTSIAHCSESLDIVLYDADLNSDSGIIEIANVTVVVGVDTQLVQLIETDQDSGKFQTSIGLSAVAEVGKTKVADGDELIVTYADEECDEGILELSETVKMDCVSPVIEAVWVKDIEALQVSVTFTSSEESIGAVLYGLSAPFQNSTGFSSGLSHEVVVSGLTPDSTYLFAVEAADGAGNTSLADNAGGYFTFTTATCSPQCLGKQCGQDGCGGQCGQCCTSQTCESGMCVGGPGCEVNNGPGCDGCPCEDCMCSLDPFCCEIMWDDLCVGQCISQCGGCGSEANCKDKECGPDSCGGVCGVCPAEWFCVDQGHCVEFCESDCDGKNCGSDGCGGSCGLCAEGQSCIQNLCVKPCADVEFVGCCDGSIQFYCEAGWEFYVDCDEQGLKCGWKESLGWYDCVPEQLADPSGKYPLWCEGVCPPECDDKECGPDGCGGVCGHCDFGASCTNGVCELDCKPQCDGRECGPDECEGLCGECAMGLVCEEGVCISSCLAQCDGRQCGPDGCDGECGKCAPGMVCSSQWQCVVKTDEPDLVAEKPEVVEFESPPRSKGCQAGGHSEGITPIGLMLFVLMALALFRVTSRQIY